MSRSFLERRRAQLEGAGRKDLAEGLERRAAEAPPAPPVIEASEPVEGEGAVGGIDASFADILGPSESDDRSAVDVVAFVKHLLDSLNFHASPATIATVEREIMKMTSTERLGALRLATKLGIQMKPVYYSKLVACVHADLESFYQETRKKIAHLGEIFGRYFWGRKIVAQSQDILKVRAMSHAELYRMLDEVTHDDVRNRGSFYQALLDRLMREI